MTSTIKTRTELMNQLFAIFDDCSLSLKVKLECLNDMTSKIVEKM